MYDFIFNTFFVFIEFRSSFRLFSVCPICPFFLLFLLQNTFFEINHIFLLFPIYFYYHVRYTGSGRQNNNPLQDVPILSPRTCDYIVLHGKRDFEDVIKVPDLEIGIAP